jgi:hypothetical protein
MKIEQGSIAHTVIGSLLLASILGGISTAWSISSKQTEHSVKIEANQKKIDEMAEKIHQTYEKVNRVHFLLEVKYGDKKTLIASD